MPVLNNASLTYTILALVIAFLWSSAPLAHAQATGTSFAVIVGLHGIGKAGDNISPNSDGNMTPLRSTRALTLTIFNASNQEVAQKMQNVTYNSTTGTFTGTVQLDSQLPNGSYTANVKVDSYLRKTIPGIIQLTSNSQKTLPLVSLVVGDANNDNALSVLDYNMVLDCFSDLLPAKNCSAQKKIQTNFNDDANVNQFDYNLFIRELSVQSGDGGSSPSPTQIPLSTPTQFPTNISSAGGINGLRVSGATIVNSSNQQIRMVGVNFSGAEYTCINNGGHWDVSADQAAITAMKSWKIRTVRITLNEDCWLGVNGITASFAQQHRQAVTTFVNLLVQNNMVPIINLHFSGDGVHAVKEQEPMANRAHSIDFWTSVATTFKGNSAVIFEPYNEPHLNDVSITGGSAWPCWRDGGCSVKGSNTGEGTFVVAGMQEMVNAIRNTGAQNIIIITGLDWGSDLSGWSQYKPTDPLNQLVAGWHTYGDGLSCGSLPCWNTTLASVIASVPIVATEIGQLPPQKGCAHDYIDQVMNWLDSHQAQGYLAWTWGPFDCADDPALIMNTNGTPTQTYGVGFRDHLLSLP